MDDNSMWSLLQAKNTYLAFCEVVLMLLEIVTITCDVFFFNAESCASRPVIMSPHLDVVLDPLCNRLGSS